MRDLTFATLRRQNEARAQRWHPGFPADNTWNGADWSNAMCGEAGEAANVVKKLRRHETGHHGALDGNEVELHDALADELADVICYADLLAAKYGIDLAVAVASKFNEVSERQGFPERLPPVTHGRHCSCSACKQEDWTRITVPCGMHGPDCPPVYAPLGAANSHSEPE